MSQIPVTTGEPVNGLLIYCLLWVGIASCALLMGYVLHSDLRAIASAIEQLDK